MNASLVRDIFPARVLAVAVALVTTGAGVFSIGASLAIAPIIEYFGWQGIFWVPALFALAVAVLVLVVVPESAVRARGERFDLLGTVLLTGALACFLVPISLGSTWGWTSSGVVALLAIAAGLAVAWVFQALRAKSPVIAIREFRSAQLLVSLLIATVGVNAIVSIFAIWGYVIATPSSAGLGYGLGLKAGDVSVFSAVFSLGSFVGGYLTGVAFRRLSPGVVTMAVELVGALGYVIAALSLSSTLGFGLGVLLLALSSGGQFSLTYNLVARTALPARQASTAAAVTVGTNIGGGLLPVVMMAALNASATFIDGAPVYSEVSLRWALLAPASLCVLLAVVGAVLTTHQRRKGNEVQPRPELST
jgi:hypothetical protein